MGATCPLYSMTKFGGYMQRSEDFEGSSAEFLCDAASTTIGSVLGLPPVTVFIESGAGITEGGRTGLTAIFTSILFFITFFFSSIFALFPPWATGPVLIIVGSLMANIANGLIAGIGPYIAIKDGIYLIELISGGRFQSEYKNLRALWSNESFTLEDVLPPWIQKIVIEDVCLRQR
ncbi:hypothetical protein BGX21_010542 [Mortierella sp. AD011]|nr:hypothetical protein BGX21_010542 [Mortierella sp. AD011]